VLIGHPFALFLSFAPANPCPDRSLHVDSIKFEKKEERELTAAKNFKQDSRSRVITDYVTLFLVLGWLTGELR